MNAANVSFNANEQAIKLFVDTELSYFPMATLADLYKSFFQDRFGPGHLIRDRKMADEYLRWEVTQTSADAMPLWQPVGVHHNFYRVYLSLVKKQILPIDILLEGILVSAEGITPPTHEEWLDEWLHTASIIRSYKPHLNNFEKEAKIIERNLSKGEPLMHHSKQFDKAYHPHYRIITKDIFEEWRNEFKF